MSSIVGQGNLTPGTEQLALDLSEGKRFVDDPQDDPQDDNASGKEDFDDSRGC